MHTDILFNSPRLRFSREQKLAILGWGKALGASNVPSLYAIERFQKQAREALDDPTEKVISAAGHVFYINNPVKLIAKVLTLLNDPFNILNLVGRIMPTLIFAGK